ncbi:MAG: RluA family pseudouridine synthase [Patescibacteria group bacterium]|nr:RluA family pseudouridine synthase [Patescibacteria group bacterium]
MTNRKIKINPTQSNQRIDKFLATFYDEKSRASWQKMIKNKKVLVNDKKVKPDYILKEGDEVKILKPTDFSFLSVPLEMTKNEKLKIPKIEIIYEDDDVIAIDKPAGTLSQKAESSKAPAISDFLIEYYPKLKEVGEDEQRYGTVHRLDKDTSGIIIVAKNNKSFKFLKNQFKNREVQKTYTALVYGDVKPKEGTIDLKIGRSKTKPNMQTVIDTKKKENIKSREALTLYKTIKNYKMDSEARENVLGCENYTLLEVQIKTGRMHQIRVHLKALGYPIIGDQKYFFKKYRNIEPKLGRQFLHAGKLKIKLPNRKIGVFESKLPKDLKNFLDKIND